MKLVVRLQLYWIWCLTSYQSENKKKQYHTDKLTVVLL